MRVSSKAPKRMMTKRTRNNYSPEFKAKVITEQKLSVAKAHRIYAGAAPVLLGDGHREEE